MSQRLRTGLLASLLLLGNAAHAGTAPEEPPATLAEVEVTGVMPGPGLWQVRRDDHVLWLVGSLTPVPRRMQWRSAEIDARLAEADAVLEAPGISVTTGRGMLHAMTLLPSALGARKLPDDKTLSDVLSPELHARWSALKAEYIGRDRGIERWRPVFAAEKLYGKRVERAGLSFDSPASSHVYEAAKRRKLPRIPVTLVITIDDPRQALREFKQGDLDDVECFERTLRHLEGDVTLLSDRARAWATGDIEALRTLHDSYPASACITALLDAPVLRQRGVDDVRTKMQAKWVEAVEQVLAEHRTTVGVVPISLLLADDGVLATLAARGYRVLGPDEEVTDEAPGALAAEAAPVTP